MNSSNVKSSDSSSEKSDRENTSTVPLIQGQIALRSGAKDTEDGKLSGEQMKTVDSSQSGSSSIQPVGAGRPQTNMQRKQQNQKKTSGEHLQKGPRNIERSDDSGNSKLCNNQQKVGSTNNLNRGSSQNSLTGKMNSMSISNPQQPIQNEFQKNSSSAGNDSPTHRNRQQNAGRNQNNFQHQPQGVGQFSYSANSRTVKVLHNQPSNGHFSNTPHSRNSGSPTHSMQMQVFPPLPYPGNEMGGPKRSATNSPGPINPLAGQHLMYPGFTRSPSLPGQEHFQSEYHHNQIGLVGIKKGYGNYPTTPLTDGTLVNDTSFVSPPVSYGTHGKFHDFRNKDLGSQSNFYGKKSSNEAVLGNRSSDGHSHKKQGNKAWKKNNSQSTPPVRGKRQTYPATYNATKYNGPTEPNNDIVGRMRIPDHPQCINHQEVFAGQPNFLPPLHSVPMLSPVTNMTAPFQQYVDAQQYTVEFHQGASYLAPQQWVPMNGGQGNFVPYTSAQIVPFTMGPGVIPPVPPNVVPYANVPNIVPFTNEANVVPYTPIPITSGVSGHGFVPPVPPPGLANVNSQLLSFTVSSRVGPFTAATEVPKHQFNLSQLERAWENPTHQKFEASSQNQSKETVPSSDDGPSNQNAKTVDEGHQRKGPEWLPDKLKKMLDVSSIEKLQRMSSTNGKRVPMNARNKESPNHLPTASPPDVQEEVIKFICDSWNKVYQEYQKGSPAVAFHVDSDPCALPEGFVPFDLEAYWGMRQVQNRSTQNIPTQNM